MMRIFAMALLLLAGSAYVSVPVEAATADGPKLKKLFQKKGKAGKVFKKNKKKTKYFHAAAKKQRKAKWQRHSMTP